MRFPLGGRALVAGMPSSYYYCARIALAGEFGRHPTRAESTQGEMIIYRQLKWRPVRAQTHIHKGTFRKRESSGNYRGEGRGDN